jgi:DDE superfamily endonuclease
MFDDGNNIIFGDDDDLDEDKDYKTFSRLAVAASIAVVKSRRKSRKACFVRTRLEWDLHVEQLHEEGPQSFARLYRMNYSSFMKLLDILRPALLTNEKMSRVRTPFGPITPQIALHCTLRWLAGGSYLDIRLSAGISVASFFRIIWTCIDAILGADGLSFEFPKNPDDAAGQFQRISSNEAIKGCVACIDGYLLEIQTPSANETGNVKAYYSGHYSTYGINVQAACDHKSRFVSVCVASPGGVNDIAAFRKTTMSKLIQNLPIGKFVIGDCAYACSEHVLTPFSGNDRLEPKQDSYNFYISQLRIRIEMAFGLLTQRWQILKRPLRTKLDKAGKVFMCLTRLHNFCINERDDLELPTTTCDLENNENAPSFLPSDPTASGNGSHKLLVGEKLGDAG